MKHNAHYIADTQLKAVESFIFFQTELYINIEGIDTIAHLLNNITLLQEELTATKQTLSMNLGD